MPPPRSRAGLLGLLGKRRSKTTSQPSEPQSEPQESQFQFESESKQEPSAEITSQTGAMQASARVSLQTSDAARTSTSSVHPRQLSLKKRVSPTQANGSQRGTGDEPSAKTVKQNPSHINIRKGDVLQLKRRAAAARASTRASTGACTVSAPSSPSAAPSSRTRATSKATTITAKTTPTSPLRHMHRSEMVRSKPKSRARALELEPTGAVDEQVEGGDSDLDATLDPRGRSGSAHTVSHRQTRTLLPPQRSRSSPHRPKAAVARATLSRQANSAPTEPTQQVPDVMYIRQVREAHVSREAGKSQIINDGLEYLKDSLSPSSPMTTRTLAVCQLYDLCTDREFRRHLRAHGKMGPLLRTLATRGQDTMYRAAFVCILHALRKESLGDCLGDTEFELLSSALHNKEPEAKGSAANSKRKKLLLPRRRGAAADRKDATSPASPSSQSSSSHAATKVKDLLKRVVRRSGDVSWSERLRVVCLETLASTLKPPQVEIQTQYRSRGILEAVLDSLGPMITKLQSKLKTGEDDPAALDSMLELSTHLKIIQRASFLHDENQAFVGSYKNFLVIDELSRLVEHAYLVILRQNGEHGCVGSASVAATAALSHGTDGRQGTSPSHPKSFNARFATSFEDDTQDTQDTQDQDVVYAAAEAGTGGTGDGVESSDQAGAEAQSRTREQLQSTLMRCCSDALRTLLSLTNNNDQTCSLLGHTTMLQSLAKLLLAHRSIVVHAFRHDLLALGLSLLGNVTEHNDDNCVTVAKFDLTKASPAEREAGVADSSGQQSSVIASLVTLFMENTRPGRDIDVDEETANNVIGAYAAVVIGCLCRIQENEDELRAVASLELLEDLVNHIDEFITYQMAAGAETQDQDAMYAVKQVLARCYQHQFTEEEQQAKTKTPA
eukprot:m.50009 g.50009  ORF g.50009 m.50009 type:complete len:896 (+) comp11131_c0_seq2:259-2946(+)